ncbi:DUF6221 family protein [Streptomyces sp. NPDC020801]|uniref:DUF6221 family protein n=1 Tax=Streptomyces sp. NPDC020801 TaxID=3365093 RepID=UPI0037B0EC38
MDELVRWLGEQLDEDELWVREAKKDGGDCWNLLAFERGDGAIYDDSGNQVLTYNTDPATGLPELLDNPLGARQAAFIAAHDPARVLRETDAKRRLVERYERAWENRRAHPDDLASAGAFLALHDAVKLLALPYADRPGYRDDWRP